MEELPKRGEVEGKKEMCVDDSCVSTAGGGACDDWCRDSCLLNDSVSTLIASCASPRDVRDREWCLLVGREGGVGEGRTASLSPTAALELLPSVAARHGQRVEALPMGSTSSRHSMPSSASMMQRSTSMRICTAVTRGTWKMTSARSAHSRLMASERSSSKWKHLCTAKE